MSLSQALATAISGLHANQTGLTLVAANVANAETAGYVRKSVSQVAAASNGASIGVRVDAIQRELDQYVQRQLRTETSGGSYADLRSQFYERLQSIFGEPGSDNALETVFNNLTSTLQALTVSPEDPSTRTAVVGAAQLLAQQLNAMSARVQDLRSDAELGILDAVTQANEAMRQIARLNQQIASSNMTDATAATLLDQRDMFIDQLSQLMDINVVKGEYNQVSIFTNSGTQLVGMQASTLRFDAQGTMTPTTLWTGDAATRNVGTITLTSPNGSSIDLIQTGAIRSGSLAAYVQMRDEDLVRAQNQLDAIAAGLASALSDETTAGSAVTSGPQSGFEIDLGGMSAGNSFELTYTDSANVTRTVTFVRVNDPAALPLSNAATLNPNDRAVGLDFSGGMSSVVAQINAALGATGMVVSNPAGNTLRVLDDGAGDIVDVDSLAVTRTQTGLTGGTALPMFLDGGMLYSGATTTSGLQSVGLAGRISINAALLGDPSKLVMYGSGVATGDSTRPDFLYDRLVNASIDFLPSSGIGTSSAPFSGSIGTFLRQVISVQGQEASTALSLRQGQEVVLSSLQQRFNEGSSVNVDEEMANLLVLQNAYAANARVMSTVKDMFDILMQM